MIYDFQEQLRKGKEAERFLDEYFTKQDFYIEHIRLSDELKLGIDRVFYRHGMRWTVEYKTDFLADKTGNAFIETKSVDDEKLGWLYTSLSQIIFYYVPGLKKIYSLDVVILRKESNNFQEKYPKRSSQNATYRSEGILVPLTELEKCGKVLEV